MCSSTVAHVLLQTPKFTDRHLQDEANGEEVGGCCLEQQPFVDVQKACSAKRLYLKNFRVMSHRVGEGCRMCVNTLFAIDITLTFFHFRKL